MRIRPYVSPRFNRSRTGSTARGPDGRVRGKVRASIGDRGDPVPVNRSRARKMPRGRKRSLLDIPGLGGAGVPSQIGARGVGTSRRPGPISVTDAARPWLPCLGEMPGKAARSRSWDACSAERTRPATAAGSTRAQVRYERSTGRDRLCSVHKSGPVRSRAAYP
jgi:hypothetical protein